MRISDWSSDVCSSDLSKSSTQKGKVRHLKTASRRRSATRYSILSVLSICLSVLRRVLLASLFQQTLFPWTNSLTIFLRLQEWTLPPEAKAYLDRKSVV